MVAADAARMSAAEPAITAVDAMVAGAAVVVAAASALESAAVAGGGVAAVAAAGAEGTGAGATATASGVVDGDNVRFALSCINSSNPAECAVRRELGLGREAVGLGFSSLRQGVPSDLVSRGAT